MNNEYDDLLASESPKEEARTNLRASVIGALPTNPDQYAEAKRLAKTTGVPAPVVERNMDEVKKQATLNEYDSLIERAPVTASKFQDREFAKLAHDERDQLAELEDFIKKAPGGRHSTDMGDALKRGVVQLGVLGESAAYGLDQMLTAIGKRFLPEPSVPGGEVDASSGQVKASLVEVANLYSNLPRDKRVDFVGEIVNRAAAEGKTLRGIGDAIAYIATPGGAKAALNYLIEMTPSAAVGGGIGGMAVKPVAARAAAAVTARSVAAGVVTPGAVATSQAVARGITAAAVTGVGTTTNAFPAELAGQISEGKEVDEALGYAGTKATVEGLVNAPFGFAGGMLPLGATLTGKVGNILGQAGLQGTGGAVGATAAAASVGEEITPGEAFLEAFFEFASAPSDIAIAAATDVAERRNATKAQVDQATAAADHLTRIMQAAEASRTRARDPETFAQLVQDAAEASGTAPTEVFIDAQPLVDTLQKAGMTEAQIREVLPSVAEQLGTEYTSGGTVAIPIGEAVAAFAGTGAEADLVRFARTTEDGYSVADSEQALAALEEMDADAQRIIAEQQDADAWAQSAQAVEDALFAQLEGAGRFSSDVNRTYATILRNYYVTQADVLGITPEALYKQFPLTASGVAPTGQALNQPGEVFDWSNPGGKGLGGFNSRDTKIGDTTISYGVGADGTAEIISVRTPQAKRGKGGARQALVKFLEEADARGLTVKLQASPLDKKTNLGKLVEFYKSLGFELTGKTINPAGDPEMVRQPLTTFDQGGNGTGASNSLQDGEVEVFHASRVGEEGLLSGFSNDVLQRRGEQNRYGPGLYTYAEDTNANAYADEIRAGTLKFQGGKGQAAHVYRLAVRMTSDNTLNTETVYEGDALAALRARLEQAAHGATAAFTEEMTGQQVLIALQNFYGKASLARPKEGEVGRRSLANRLLVSAGVDYVAGRIPRPDSNGATDSGVIILNPESASVRILNGASATPEMIRRPPTTFDQEVKGTTPYTADTIVVDGKTRPVVNANGQRIAQTEEGLRNFWRWFGDSKVVDDQGRPLVVYHGSPKAGFNTFDEYMAGENTGNVNNGFFFTESRQNAATYSGSRPETEAQVSDDPEFNADYDGERGIYSVYLKTDDPLSVDFEGRNWDGADENGDYTGEESVPEVVDIAVTNGNDGVIIDNVTDEGPHGSGYHWGNHTYVVFKSEQIKSATSNRGTYDPADPNILNQSGVGQEPRDLYVGHNITAEKIRHALDLGGLPAPSLGIGRTTTGGFEGFGDITLLAPKEILESDGARTFNADVYSPRQPRPVYKPDPKGFDALLEKLRALPGGFSVADIDEVGRYGADALARSDAIKLLYLTETEQAPKIKKQKVPAEIKKAAKLPHADRSYSLRENPDFAVIAKKHYSDAVAQMEQAGEMDVADKMRSHYFEDDGEVTFRFLDELARKVSRYVNENGVDTGALRQDIAKKLRTPAQSDAFEKWVKDLAAPILGDKKLEISPSRRIPYTLDNVTAQMIKELRGGEGFNYGAGNIRAMFTAELDSVQAVQNRREEIVSGAEMQKAKSESQARLSDTLNDLKRFYKYDANGWGYMDDASRAIAEGPKGWREAFKINAESEKIIRDYISYLNNLPTEYFETKMQRSVDISEFTVAIVPKGTPQDVVAALEGKGLTIKTYDPKKPGARMKAIKAVDAEQDVLFQSAYHGSPYRFSKFSLEHMGKGEGAQAYGWGLYFAGKREVAEHYRQVLTTRSPDALQRHALKNGLQAEVADAMAQFHAKAKSSSFDDFASMVMEKSPSEYIELFREKYLRPAIVDGSAKAAWDSFKDAGQLYEVDIPEDGEYLLWDKPLAEQPEKVRAALLGAGRTYGQFDKDATGNDLYQDLVAEFDDSDKAASLYLKDLGIAGIKYLDGSSRGAGEGSYNYVIFDDNAVRILNTFYQNQPGKAEARGSFNPATLNIALLEKADLSTFLHETGHFFFEMQVTIAARPDAPARIVNDVAVLLKEVGFTGTAAEWLAQPLDARREAHEKVAESFEQYLITGDAPTVELQSLFNQMRAWMLAVYKTLKQFFAVNNRAGLSAEVAGVFDRMLASDAAIAETKRVRAMSPLFTSAEAAGMTAEEWAAYQADAGQMDADARRDLDARQVRDMKWLRSARGKALKALQADASAKRREARIEARRRLLQEPVYRAMQFLRGKVEKAEVEKKAKGLDTRRDDLLTAIAKLGGLNKDLVVAEWGIDPKDFTKSPVFGKPILRGGKAGLSPDGMGEALAEVGYLQPKDGDRYSLADFEAMFNDAARGIQHYSLDADYDLIHGYKTLPVAADLGEQPFAAGRLSRPDLEARFANSDVDWQRLGVGRRGMIAEVGMDADAVANIVGFNTGEEMVKALLVAEPIQEATEALTDQIMLERYGDITSPEGLQRAADEALANDAHAKLLATEYARLNKAVGSPRAVQLAAKEAAERTVDRQAVRLARPEKATAAAARAGKAAEKAHAAGNLDEAAGFKRNQILNTAIARAQRELRTFVDKAQGDFAKMFGKDDQRAKTRDMNLVNLARAALAQYGLAPTAGGKQALQYLELVTQYDPALAENLKSMLAAMPEGKDFRDLTAGEFRTVASIVRGMWEMSRGVKQITIDGKKVEIDAAADELVAAVMANNGGEQGNLPGYSSTTTTADDLRVGALGIKSMLTRVEQWADFMGPAFKRFIWQPVSEAVTRYRVRRNEMVKQYRDLLKTIEPDLTFHKIHAPELGLGGFTFNAGKSEVLHAILHSGNESNLRKLLLGRGWATVDAEGNLDTSRWDAFVRRMADEGVITRNDMDFVQGVWDLLETVKGDAQKAHRELYGYYFNEVTATPFVDPFGVERRGGYVPALADGLSSPDAMQKREQEELLHAGNSFMFPSTGKGFTQARVEYNRPLELDLRTIGSHLDKVTRFAYIEPAVRDVGKLLLNKRVSRALNGYDQTIISQMLNPWLQRAARQTISVPGKNRWADKFFNGLRSRSGVVIMFANVVNTLQQITGFSVAATKVPAPVLLRATYRMVTDPKRMSAEAAALSPWLAERMAGQSFEMQQEIENILVNPNPLVKGNEFLKHNAYFMQQAMQNMMDPIIWWGAYDNAVANGAGQRDAIRAGDEAVRTTQGTFAPEDVSAFESNTAFVRLFTQFYGYFNMLANTLGLDAKKAIRDMGYGAATPRLLFIWFAGLALPAVVAEIIARGLPDDEDDEDGDGVLDEWLALFFGSQGRTLAAMAPGVGQGVSLAVNLTDDKVYNDRLSISPGMSMAETTIRGGVNLLQGEVFDDRLTKAEVRDTLTLIGMATGAPTGAVARAGGYLVDVENGKADPENPVEFAVGLTTGR